MDGSEFDIERLRSIPEIDLDKALDNFSSQSEFIMKLTEFCEHAKHDLARFSPYKISSRAETRKEFLKELKNLRANLSLLGMTYVISELKHLETAAFNKDEKLLERELTEFVNKLEHISDRIDSARIDEQASPAVQENAAPKRASLADEISEKHIILAVDDMKSLLSSVVSMLLDRYVVMAVTSGKAALKVLEKYKPSLFLLDIEMPEMDGYELAATIRSYEDFKDTPIIFLTAKGGRDDVIAAIKYGVNDYIVKPVEKELLLSKMDKYLA